MQVSIYHRLALVGATATSAIALDDAVTHGLTGHNTIFADTSEVMWANVGAALVHAFTYGALFLVLVEEGARIDAANRLARLLRRVLMACLGVLCVGFIVIEPARVVFDPPIFRTPWTVVATVVFLGMLLSATALGPALLRRPDLRLGARLLSLMVPLFGLTLLLGVVAPGWSHPAYLETTLHFGIALLGVGAAASSRHTVPPTRQPVLWARAARARQSS